MGHLVVLVCHLWLTLSQQLDRDKMPLLDAAVSLQGLFGPVMEQMRRTFEATQKSADAKKMLPQRKDSTGPAASPLSSWPWHQHRPCRQQSPSPVQQHAALQHPQGGQKQQQQRGWKQGRAQFSSCPGSQGHL